MDDTHGADYHAGEAGTVAALRTCRGELRDALLEKRAEVMRALEAVDKESTEAQQELRRRLDEARNKREPLEEALSHLDALLKMEGWVPPQQNVTPAYAVNSKPPVEAAHDLLGGLGKPLHYRELAQRLAENGVHIGGKDPGATLLSQMSRDDRFKRGPERGLYGLASWRMRKSPSKAGRAKRKRGENARK